MARDTVKWFSDQKGYGFIAADDQDEVFVHHSAIEGNGFRTLHEGDLVEYDVKQSDKGNEASHVIRVI